MRHNKRTAKLGMKSQHRRATLANLVCSLIAHNRIRTTVAKAKVARRLADRMITLAKKGSLHHRRLALAVLRDKSKVKKLFAELGKQHGDRNGGYTRIIRLGPRRGDAAEMAILEWTGAVAPVAEPETTGKAAEPTTPETKTEPKKSPRKSKKAAESKEAPAAS
jgi:large subunit ribosomal protein L17